MQSQGFLRDTLAAVDTMLHPPLTKAMGVEGTLVPSPAGDLFVYEDTHGAGDPVVLVHSVNAAASSYEMRPIFEALRGKRPVLAFDLPGFGRSERGNRRYDQALYKAAVLAMIERATQHKGGTAHVVALSLGSEFAAAAALERPELVRSLALISPTGLGSRMSLVQQHAADGRPERVLQTLSFPLIGAPLFRALVTRPSIRYFLAKSFAGPVDKGLAEYAHRSGLQRGARFAPLAFLSGSLFDPEVLSQVYEKLTLPVLVLYDRDAYTDFSLLPALMLRPNWTAERISPTRGMPQFDQPERTLVALRAFWAPLDAEDARMDEASKVQPGY